MKKRLVFCFDGSWNKLSAEHPTNVVLTAESVLPSADGVAQLIFYDEGVGTERFEKLTGGMLGWGLEKNLGDAYRFLIFNHTPGDEIFVFGFSRGAFTARSFVGLLYTCGILQRPLAGRVNDAIDLYRQRDESQKFKQRILEFRRDMSPHIRVSDEEDLWRAHNVPAYDSDKSPQLLVQYVGVWDTVGALGLPEYLFEQFNLNRRHEFHDHRLNRFVRNARHAVAIDERKKDFRPTLWEDVDQLNIDRGVSPEADDAPYQQKWFPGGHGSIGGGGDRQGLSDDALEWIWDGARAAGLVLDRSPNSRIYELTPDYRDYLENSSDQPTYDFTGIVMSALPKEDRQPGPKALHEVSLSARRRWHEDPSRLADGEKYRPKTLANVAELLNALDPAELGVGDAVVDLPAGSFTIYEIQKGDTLTEIAHRHYGDRAKYKLILDANRDKIRSKDLIYAGQTLRLPNP